MFFFLLFFFYFFINLIIGKPVVRDYGIREDANTKGAKKSRRSKGLSFGSNSTKSHDMEVFFFIFFFLEISQKIFIFL